MDIFEKYLKLFNLKENYTEEELNRAYKRLTLKYRHSTNLSEADNKKYGDIKEAYEYIQYYLEHEYEPEEKHNSGLNESMITFFKVLLFLICLVILVAFFNRASEDFKKQEAERQEIQNKEHYKTNTPANIDTQLPRTQEIILGQTDYNFDKKDFDVYMYELDNKLQSNWYPPENSSDGEVLLSIDIAKDGSLLNVGVKESSGNILLDNSALNAVKESAPFNPLPSNYNGSSINIQFTFDYNNYIRNWTI